jgi:hypothetical protein
VSRGDRLDQSRNGSRRTTHLPAKAAVTVYDAAVGNSRPHKEQAVAFSEQLAGRVRDALTRTKGVAEKKMFGGIGFLLDGNLLVGVWKDFLIARLGPEQGDEALLEPHVRPFDITGRPMKGWVLVGAAGVAGDEQLAAWIQRAVAFVGKLPAK